MGTPRKTHCIIADHFDFPRILFHPWRMVKGDFFILLSDNIAVNHRWL